MYLTRWKAIVGEGLESQEIFSSSEQITPQYLGFLRTQVFPGLRIGLATGIDSETSVTGSASFRTGTAGPDGNLVAVGVLIRLEADVNQNRFRVTIRGKHPQIVQALKAVIKSVLGKIN